MIYPAPIKPARPRLSLSPEIIALIESGEYIHLSHHDSKIEDELEALCPFDIDISGEVYTSGPGPALSSRNYEVISANIAARQAALDSLIHKGGADWYFHIA